MELEMGASKEGFVKMAELAACLYVDEASAEMAPAFACHPGLCVG